MLLRDYTTPELQRYIDGCNFTDSELQYFMLRSKDKSNIQIASAMHIELRQVSYLSSRVRAKMSRL